MRLAFSVLFFIVGLVYLPAQVATHKVKPGETLYRIAQQCGISVKILMEANNISDPTSIKVGTVLQLPGQEQKVKSASTANQIQPSVEKYQVVPGDTYYSIAKRHNISVVQLLNANHRTDKTVLKVGEVLSVEATPIAMQPAIQKTPFVSQPSAPTSLNTIPVVDNLTWPVAGHMMRHDGKQGGVKIRLNSPQDVHAVASGTVVYHGRYRELGPIVLVEHEGRYIYIYAGVSSSLLKVGDKVAVGDILGRTTTGHDMVFSVFKDANPIDPQEAPRV